MKLNLAPYVIGEPKSSPASRSRFIYYPDHLVLLPHPSQGMESILDQLLWSEEPLYQGVIWDSIKKGLLRQFRTEDARSLLRDESIESCFARRASPILVDRFVSAFLHGVYAGDASELSANSIFPFLKFLEYRHGSALKGAYWMARNRKTYDTVCRREATLKLSSAEVHQKYTLGSLSMLRGTSSWTLKGGLEKIPQALVKYLREKPNVKLCTNQTVTTLTISGRDQKVRSPIPRDVFPKIPKTDRRSS